LGLVALSSLALFSCQSSTTTGSPSAHPSGGGPTGRSGAAAGFDPATGELVIFGGTGGSATLDDTWVHDKTSWKHVDTQTHPSGRFNAAASEDIVHHNLVLFGGYGGAPLADTWVWSRGSWTLMHPSTSPGPRFGHTMAYDSVRQRVVLFGGQSGPNAVLNDTWTWDGDNWTRVAAAGGPAAGKAFGAMAFDSRIGVTVLTGVIPDGDLSTWTFDGTNWMRLLPTGQGNQPWADNTPAAYYPTAGKVFMFVAGPRPPDPPGRLLAFEGSAWLAVDAAVLPPARVGATFALCPALNRLVLFGGAAVTLTTGGLSSGQVLSDTWTWDGHNWTPEA